MALIKAQVYKAVQIYDMLDCLMGIPDASQVVTVLFFPEINAGIIPDAIGYTVLRTKPDHPFELVDSEFVVPQKLQDLVLRLLSAQARLNGFLALQTWSNEGFWDS